MASLQVLFICVLTLLALVAIMGWTTYQKSQLLKTQTPAFADTEIQQSDFQDETEFLETRIQP